MVQYLSFIIDHNYVSITLLNFFFYFKTEDCLRFWLKLQQTFNDEWQEFPEKKIDTGDQKS